MRAFLCLAPTHTVAHLAMQVDGVREVLGVHLEKQTLLGIPIPEEIGIVVQVTPFNTYLVTVGPPPWQ